MRDIKFRIWNWNEDKTPAYIEITPGSWLDEGGIPDNAIVEQFTGLHDKNGKEIYEGDIIKFKNMVREATGKIIFNEHGFFAISYLDSQYTYSDVALLNRFDTESNCEIIGNIFENPELL